MAEHSFYEYQRLVQKEAEPELIIQLANRGDDLEEADMRPPMIESEDASLQTPMNLVVTVAFAVAQPGCGLQFCDRYACTDSQVASATHVCLAAGPAYCFCMLLICKSSYLCLIHDRHAPNSFKAQLRFYVSPSQRLLTCIAATDSVAV